MAHSTRSIRIGIASLLALLMIGGTYLSTGPNPFFGMTRIAGAQSSEELLREYAAKDSDADSLPDWQEALYGTDPLNPESFQAGIKDGEAVAQGLIEPKVAVRPEASATDLDSVPGTVAAPSSLTDRFAQTLLTQYLSNRGVTPPTTEEIVAFVETGVADLAANASSPDAFSTNDIRSSGTSGSDALATYAASVDSAFASNTIAADKNELYFFADALKGDADALAEIAAISAAYADIASALMLVPVPTEARQSHLAIANALMRMSSVTADMATMDEDPLRALLGIGLYKREVESMSRAFANMSAIFSAQQVTISPSAPGYGIFEMSRRAASTTQ